MLYLIALDKLNGHQLYHIFDGSTGKIYKATASEILPDLITNKINIHGLKFVTSEGLVILAGRDKYTDRSNEPDFSYYRTVLAKENMWSGPTYTTVTIDGNIEEYNEESLIAISNSSLLSRLTNATVIYKCNSHIESRLGIEFPTVQEMKAKVQYRDKAKVEESTKKIELFNSKLRMIGKEPLDFSIDIDGKIVQYNFTVESVPHSNNFKIRIAGITEIASITEDFLIENANKSECECEIDYSGDNLEQLHILGASRIVPAMIGKIKLVFNIPKHNIKSLYSLLTACNSVRYVDLSCMDLTPIENMDTAFGGCRYLKYVDFGDLNMPNLISAAGVFYRCDNGETANIDTIQSILKRNKEKAKS